MDDHSQLIYLTRHYYELQGIRTLPLWFFMLAIQFQPNSAHTNGPVHDVFIFAAICLMALCQWLAGRYYRSRFGWLKPTWIIFPTSRVYWVLVHCFFFWFIYSLFFLHFHGNLPYLLTLAWVSPAFSDENLPVRRIYFALAGAMVVFSSLFLQIARWDGRIIIAIQCVALVALGIADHLLLMSLCIPLRENADA